MQIVRADAEFVDLSSTRHTHGTMRWGRGLGDEPLHEGDELEPYESVGYVHCGEDGKGVAVGVGVDSFGTVRKLLVPDGATVRPGQPLMEFEARPPTLAEWTAERDRACAAEQRVRDLQRELHNPARAAWMSLRRWFGGG